jgi:hypothetical protein
MKDFYGSRFGVISDFLSNRNNDFQEFHESELPVQLSCHLRSIFFHSFVNFSNLSACLRVNTLGQMLDQRQTLVGLIWRCCRYEGRKLQITTHVSHKSQKGPSLTFARVLVFGDVDIPNALTTDLLIFKCVVEIWVE